VKIFIPVLILIGLFACNQAPPQQNRTTLNFDDFTIETPKSWTQVKQQGVDSYVGRIAIDDKDTLDFDLGWYSNTLYEYDPIILDSDMISSIDTSRENIRDIIFVKKRKLLDPDRYRKNNVRWETIDGRKAKIVYPRQPGTGITGVYIDSLWVRGSDIDY
jgi:hypothetical protein